MCSARAPRNSDPGPAAAWGCWSAALLLAALLPIAAADGARLSDRIVAVVNDEVITLSELQAEIRGEARSLRRDYQGAELERRLRQLEYKALTSLIERRLQMQLARKRGHVATEQEIKQALRELPDLNANGQADDPDLKRSIREQLTVLKVLEREVRSGVTVSEEELKQYYDEHKEYFMLPEEYRISQIFIRRSPDEAAADAKGRLAEARAALENGADFAEVAVRLSEGPGSAHGGSLGMVRQGELEPALEQAIAGLKPGEISAPIETERGFHILRLDDRPPPRYQEFSHVRAQIQNALYKEKSEHLYHTWINRLKDDAYIEVKF